MFVRMKEQFCRAQDSADAVDGMAQYYRDRLRPLINTAIMDEAHGKRGSRAAAARALLESLEALELAAE